MFGSLVGASLGLLIAPLSGEATRNKLRDRGQALRARALETADEARAKAEAVQARSKAVLVEKVERVTRTAEAVKRTAQETWQQGDPARMPAGRTGPSDY